MWDNNIEDIFFRVYEFIEKCSKAGCIFNPQKFQFAQETVDFLGFRITPNGMKPHPDFLRTIQEFPTPKNITDVRSWFGLIGQVSYAFAATNTMEPFRKLLSSKLPFYWSTELEEAFILSKSEIVKQCELGVRKFSLTAPMALATDWSKSGVGCWLTQKFCSCEGCIPGCCKSGWQTIYVSSKFNSPAVSRYHPVEGEAYAAAWALEKCRIFVLGHPNLTLAVDHKPLLAILGLKQELADVINPRLMSFKLKSMAYSFKPIHIPGKKHVVPDAFSRRSDSPILTMPKQENSLPTSDNILPGYSDSLGPPSWVSGPLEANSIEADAEKMMLANTTAVLANLISEQPAEIAANQPNPEVITWARLSKECEKCPIYVKLHAQTIN